MSDFNYGAVYTSDFFNEADGIGDWKRRKLKYGDALAAIGYAFGVDLDSLRALVPFEGVGRRVVEDGLDASALLSKLCSVQKRVPKSVLEIGTGRGEVAASLGHLGYQVQGIDPCPEAADWCRRTALRFFGSPLNERNVKIVNLPAHLAIDVIDWSAIDTVIMVESLEHILADDFEAVYCAITQQLRASSGRFVVTNWLDYHPIRVGDYAAPEIHCRLVDDALYDKWSAEARGVFYRNGSHLALDY